VFRVSASSNLLSLGDKVLLSVGIKGLGSKAMKIIFTAVFVFVIKIVVNLKKDIKLK
jgi:hypothetical protein